VDRAHALRMHAIVTVFSTELVDFAERLPWDAYKTASPDIVHKPLLHALARTGRPLILSTGAATLEEVQRTTTWLREWRACSRTALMQCVSCYPTPKEHAELGGIAALAQLSEGPVGYSDHTPGEQTGRDAVAAGAHLLEKHLTYSRSARGPDHAASLESAGMLEYVTAARAALPSGRGGSPPTKRVLPIEQDVRTVSRQSIVAARALRPGDVLASCDITIKRPGTGIPAADLQAVVGRRVAANIDADTVIMPGDLA
jgi:N,N'-diacetyllegionaminate synthase